MALELKKIFSILKIKLSVLNKGKTYVLVLRFFEEYTYLIFDLVQTVLFITFHSTIPRYYKKDWQHQTVSNGWLVCGLTSRSTNFRSCWDEATASCVFTSTL